MRALLGSELSGEREREGGREVGRGRREGRGSPLTGNGNTNGPLFTRDEAYRSTKSSFSSFVILQTDLK